MEADYARSYRTLWERHWWWRSREAFLLGWIRRLSHRGAIRRILDVGCGDGLFFEQLQRFGDVEGLEPDATLVRDPRWSPRIRVEALGQGPPDPQGYDLVLMLDVLEHIADERGALAAAAQAMRPGGRLLVTVPALPRLWSRHDEANAHVRRYVPAALRGALEGAGLEVETVRFFFFWTVLPLLLRRWLEPAGTGTSDYAVPIPAAPVNRALAWISRAEHAAGRFLRWPVGSSLLAIARRPPGRVGSARGRSSLFGRRAVALDGDTRRMGAGTDPGASPREPVSP